MKFSRKIALALLSTVMAIGIVSTVSPFVTTVSAEQSAEITQVKNTRKKSVVLTVKADGMNNKMGIANVEVKNNSTGKTRMRNFLVRFDNDSNGRVRIRGLKAGTEYTFRIRLRSEGDKFGPFSSSQTAKTQS